MLGNLLIQKVSLLRPAYTQGDNLGIVKDNRLLYDNLPASVQPISATVQLFYAEREIQISHTIYVNTGAISVKGQLNLQRGDTISDGANTFEVKGWREQAGRGVVTAIDCNLTVT